MANNYYTFSSDFVPGQKVRSDDMNTQLNNIEAAFDNLPASVTAIKRGVAFRGTEGGSGSSFTITMDDTRTAYADGDRVLFKATHSNTAASSINVDSIGVLSLVNPDGDPTSANDVLSGRYYEAVYVAASNHFQLLSPNTGAVTNAALYAGYSEEWAITVEDTLVSTAAGGNGVDEYSSHHWAAKASASGTAAASSASAASTSETNAAASESAAGTSETNAAASETAAGTSETNAGLSETAAALSETNAGISETNSGASETAADASETAAGLSETAAALSETNAAASETAAASSAASINLPTISGGDTDKILEVNAAEDGYDLVSRAASETATGFVELATDAEMDAGTSTSLVTTPDAIHTTLKRDMVITNRIPNGNFFKWSGGISFAALSASGGDRLADGWRYFSSGVGVVTIERGATGTGIMSFNTFLKATVTPTADASIAAGDYYILSVEPEGYDVSDFMLGRSTAEAFTVSFWHNHTVTGTHSVAVRNSARDRSYSAEYTQSVASTWEYASITIPGDTGGTWARGGAAGLSLLFSLAVGSTNDTVPGSWLGTGSLGSTGQVNNMLTVSNLFQIGGVRVDKGERAGVGASELTATLSTVCGRARFVFDTSGGEAPMGFGRTTSTTIAAILVPTAAEFTSLPTYAGTPGDLRIVSNGTTYTATAVTPILSVPSGVFCNITSSGMTAAHAATLEQIAGKKFELFVNR